MADLRELVERWRDKAVRWSLAGPTANGQTVDALRYCADELESALAAASPGTQGVLSADEVRKIFCEHLPTLGMSHSLEFWDAKTQLLNNTLFDAALHPSGQPQELISRHGLFTSPDFPCPYCGKPVYISRTGGGKGSAAARSIHVFHTATDNNHCEAHPSGQGDKK